MTYESCGFERLETRDVPERSIVASVYKHTRSGATLLCLDNDDPNKAFCIAFRTPVANSSGIAHIMEHSVLCGSEKYPLKEPFIELVKGSLNTFLNAFTGSSETYYPVASLNAQDLYNLVDVYLDAVFHPRLTPQTLAQEGWHYEVNAAGTLEYKGVVYNEMKGAYSAPDRLLYDSARRALFPDNAYCYDSGGDPDVIPELTWPQFESFHRNHYHPSNSLIVWYGDDHTDNRFALLSSYLNDFEAREPIAMPVNQSHWQERRSIDLAYAADPEQANDCMLAISWLTKTSVDPLSLAKLHLLRYVLVGTPASPLKKSILDSGLAKDINISVGSNRQAYVVAGLKGIAPGDVAKCQAFVENELRRLADNGIPPEVVTAAMNSTEFAVRENNSGSFPRGLSLALEAIDGWLGTEDFLSPLYFEEDLSALRAWASDPRELQQYVRDQFVTNMHQCAVRLVPDTAAAAAAEAATQEKLARIRESLTGAEIETIQTQSRLLEEAQQAPNSEEALASLPKLSIKDLDTKNKTTPREVRTVGAAHTITHTLPTNGIVYVDVALDLHRLPTHLLSYTSLFGRALTEMGTNRRDYVTLIQDIGRETGGIWRQTMITGVHGEPRAEARLVLRGKALAAKSEYLLETMQEMLLEVNLDQQERFRQMVNEERTRLLAGVVPSGSRYVDCRLRSHYSEAGAANERTGGLEYIMFVHNLAERVVEDWPAVLADLRTVASLVVSQQNAAANITADAAGLHAVHQYVERVLMQLPLSSAPTQDWPSLDKGPADILIAPTQVNYVGQCGNLFDIGYEWSGSVGVVANYLRTGYLWDRVRIQGGAYGAACRFDPYTGVFGFTSYRDPNINRTIDTYAAAGKHLAGLELSHDEVTSAIIGVIGDMDAYQLPDAEGFTSFLRWLTRDTDSNRQQRRDQVLATTLADFRAFGAKLADAMKHPSTCVLTNESAARDAGFTEPESTYIKIHGSGG